VCDELQLWIWIWECSAGHRARIGIGDRDWGEESRDETASYERAESHCSAGLSEGQAFDQY
jgi:hypothetical protein